MRRVIFVYYLSSQEASQSGFFVLYQLNGRYQSNMLSVLGIDLILMSSLVYAHQVTETWTDHGKVVHVKIELLRLVKATINSNVSGIHTFRNRNDLLGTASPPASGYTVSSHITIHTDLQKLCPEEVRVVNKASHFFGAAESIYDSNLKNENLEIPSSKKHENIEKLYNKIFKNNRGLVHLDSVRRISTDLLANETKVGSLMKCFYDYYSPETNPQDSACYRTQKFFMETFFPFQVRLVQELTAISKYPQFSSEKLQEVNKTLEFIT